MKRLSRTLVTTLLSCLLAQSPFAFAQGHPRKAAGMPSNGKKFAFRFLDLAGSKRGGYLKDMVLTILDADHHRLEVNFVAPMARPLPFMATSQEHRSKARDRVVSAEVVTTKCRGN